MNHDKFVREQITHSKIAFMLIVIGDIIFLHLLLDYILKDDLPRALYSLTMLVIFSVAIKPFYNTVLEKDKILQELDHPTSKLN